MLYKTVIIQGKEYRFSIIKSVFHDFLEVIDIVFGKILSLRRRGLEISDDDFQIIASIHDEAFPKANQPYSNLSGISEWMKLYDCYYQAQLYGIVKEDWYLLMVRHYNVIEIIEFAGKDGKCKDIFRVINYVTKEFKGKHIATQARDATSWKLLQLADKRGTIKIIKNRPRTMKNELYHDVILTIL